METNKGVSSLTVKERNWAARSSILRNTNERLSVSMQNESNQFAKSMDFEAKKLRTKLTLLMSSNNPNARKDARSSAWEENSEETRKLKLPALIKGEVQSAPSSPSLKSQFRRLSVSPPGSEAWMSRRVSSSGIDSPRSYSALSRKTSRSFSSRDMHRPSLVLPIFPGAEDDSAKVSPLMPRNLKLRELARRGNGIIGLPNESDAPPLSPTLEDQFKSLETCRYLRRGTEGDVEGIANETPDTQQSSYYKF